MKLIIASVLLLVSPFLNLNAQNVGIGTSTPAERLQVIGNIQMDTAKVNAILLAPNAGPGKILTSDNEGNATWENLVLPPPIENDNGNVGYGVWGDCATNGNISEYYPVADAEGLAGDNFGISVSISGNYAIIGASSDDGIAGVNQGSASIYQFDGSHWVFMQKLTDADGAPNDFFGTSVSVSGNYCIVGAYADDGDAGVDQGSASIYQFNGNNWVLMEKITDADAGAGDSYGRAVSVSGNKIIVGAYSDDDVAGVNQGSASIYQFDGTNWIFIQKLTDNNGASGDAFGISVCMADTYVIIGAHLDSGPVGSYQGSASIYQYDGSNWTLMQKLLDTNGGVSDFFGFSVSISANEAIVGSPNDDGSAGVDQGSVSIYKFDGNSWIRIKKQTDINGAENDHFGYSVSIGGDYIMVGANGDTVNGNFSQGSSSVYKRLGSVWQRYQYVTDPYGAAADALGYSTSIDPASKRFLLGAYHFENSVGKAVFGKIN
jgi:hypothetical protein